MIALLAGHIKPLVGEITDAGRETKAQQMAERENVIGESGRIGVVFLDPQIGLVVEKPVEHVRRIAHRGVDDLGVERRVLIRHMGVEQHARFIAIVGIAVSGRFAPAASTGPLAVGRAARSFTPERGKG